MFLAFSLYFPCLNLSYIYVLTFFFFSSFKWSTLSRKKPGKPNRKRYFFKSMQNGLDSMSITWANPDSKVIRALRSVTCHQCGQKWKVHSDLQKHQNSLFRIQRRVVLMNTWKIISASTVQVVWMVETKARTWKHIARLFLLGKADIETEGGQGHLTEGP